jgi:hypothetical protein
VKVLSRAALIALALFACVLPAQSIAAGTGLDAYDVKTTPKVLKTLGQWGFDVTEARHGNHIEIVATRGQARSLKRDGITATLKRDRQGRTARQRFDALANADGSYDNYRPYWDDTYVGEDSEGKPRPTLYQELIALATAHPDIVKPETIGHTVNGVPILALKVTNNARTTPDGQRPAVLYSSNQHAREWITAESNRRLVHLFVDNYTNPDDTSLAKNAKGADIGGEAAGLTKGALTKIVNENELWFVVVANPDGYDFTFTDGNRLWRKNLRDNNGDGQITAIDGVDPNRNFPTKWGYDNEGSGAEPQSETYRGTAPASEPETKAMDGLLKRVGFEFQINYHSAAELLLYPIGWQQTTYTADDPIYRALSGTDEDSAIKGQEPGAPDPYDPDVAAELYITNGETTDHAHARYGTLAWTPEMDVADPDRGGGDSVFKFQDSDADLEDALEKNIPFALDVARSAKDPANPVSHLGNDVPDFEVSTFGISYGSPQTVQVDAKRELGAVTMHYKVNNGAERIAPTKEWDGGQVYGGDSDIYFHRVRGAVNGVKPGDEVKVWFTGGGKQSQSFSYTMVSDSKAPVLIMAAEDYSGKPGAFITEAPAYADRTKPNYLKYYEDTLKANGIKYDVWDVDGRDRTAPDPLGVLSHYKAVIWYTGNDLLVRDAGAPGGSGTSLVAQDEIVNVRDYLNEGGKLLYTGKNAADAQLINYPYNPAGQPPFCDTADRDPLPPDMIPDERCAVLNDDFLQYWLGAYVHINAVTLPEDADGEQGALAAVAGKTLFNAGDPFGLTSFQLNGGDSANNQDHLYSMVTTSSILPPAQFPQFKSTVATGLKSPPLFDPPSGTHYMVASSRDEGWQRLTHEIDMTGKTAGSLKFKISYDTEASYDYVVVEAHTKDQDDWTTLKEVNGGTTDDVGSSCDINWDTLHPFLTHYQTNTNKSEDPGDEDCTPEGTTGTPPGHWFGATGNSGGFQDWEFDLSPFAGKDVEVSISYIQDFASAGLGVFVDDASITRDGTTESTDFEGGNGGWVAADAPEGSANDQKWTNRTSVGYKDGPGVATARSLYYGFGLEGIRTGAARNAFMADAMRYLGVFKRPGGGGGGGGGGTPGTPDYTIRISKQKLRVDKHRRTKVRLSCGPTVGKRCKGSVTLTRGKSTRMGRRSFSITANKTRNVTVRIKKSAFKRLKRQGRIRTKITVTTRGSDGKLRRKSQKVTMVLKKSKKK